MCVCVLLYVCGKRASVYLCPRVGGKTAIAQRGTTKERQRVKTKSRPTALLNIHKEWSDSQ